MPNLMTAIIEGVRRYKYDWSKDIEQAPKAGRNSDLLAQRDARVCTNIYCDNTDYMPLEFEYCPSCNKKVQKTIRQEEPPYVKVG